MACSHGESSFQHALPKSRLGTSHATLEAYDEAVKQSGRRDQTQIPTEFSLVVLLSPNYIHQRQQGKSSSISILLGKKLRGFGKGFYNCFGGKLEKHLDEHKHPARGAVREIEEETGIPIPLEVMEHGYVGTLNFTFDDWEVNKAMKVYLYCVLLTSSGGQEEDEHNTLKPDDLAKVVIEPGIIRGCEEIEPMWLYNVYEVPLEEMFADDSIWLTMLLSHYDHFFSTQKVSDDQIPVQRKLLFDAWFHFQAGGAESNKVLHHHIKMNTPDTMLCSASPPEVTETKYTLEKQLFHALHMNQIHSPSVKEFKENWAMANAVRRHLGDQVEYVIDVAGGHGALGENCHSATVIDPAVVKGKEGIQKAWSPFLNAIKDDSGEPVQKQLKYRHECLRTGLRDELEAILGKGSKEISPTRVLVVACHACQHLTDETIRIASEYGVNVACMPCCQKDHDGWWKRTAKDMGLSIGAIMDLLSAGKMMAWETGSKSGVKYQVKMKLIDKKISPLQNRIILCKALDRNDDGKCSKTKLAHEKLTKAYQRAHRRSDVSELRKQKNESELELQFDAKSILLGFCMGMAATLFITYNKQRKF